MAGFDTRRRDGPVYPPSEAEIAYAETAQDVHARKVRTELEFNIIMTLTTIEERNLEFQIKVADFAKKETKLARQVEKLAKERADFMELVERYNNRVQKDIMEELDICRTWAGRQKELAQLDRRVLEATEHELEIAQHISRLKNQMQDFEFAKEEFERVKKLSEEKHVRKKAALLEAKATFTLEVETFHKQNPQAKQVMIDAEKWKAAKEQEIFIRIREADDRDVKLKEKERVLDDREKAFRDYEKQTYEKLCIAHDLASSTHSGGSPVTTPRLNAPSTHSDGSPVTTPRLKRSQKFMLDPSAYPTEMRKSKG
jgi:hypothetical protein